MPKSEQTIGQDQIKTQGVNDILVLSFGFAACACGMLRVSFLPIRQAARPALRPRASARFSSVSGGEKHLRECSSAHLWRTKRRSLFLERRQVSDLPASGPVLRSAYRREHRTEIPCDQIYTMRVPARATPGEESGRAKAGQQRQGPHHVQLFLSFGRSHPVFLHVRRERGVPAPARLFPRLRLAHL